MKIPEPKRKKLNNGAKEKLPLSPKKINVESEKTTSKNTENEKPPILFDKDDVKKDPKKSPEEKILDDNTNVNSGVEANTSLTGLDLLAYSSSEAEEEEDVNLNNEINKSKDEKQVIIEPVESEQIQIQVEPIEEVKPKEPEIDYSQFNQYTEYVRYPPKVMKGAVSVNISDIGRLRENAYLNDSIIDFYMKYLCLEKLEPDVREKIFLFSQFFYTKLLENKDATPKRRKKALRTWTRKKDLFSKDYILIPINESNHWSLVIVTNPGQCFLDI
eukprot:UN32853